MDLLEEIWLGDAKNLEYFQSGWWDQASRECPEAFFEINIVGRPAQ
jgi:hypothetical protein